MFSESQSTIEEGLFAKAIGNQKNPTSKTAQNVHSLLSGLGERGSTSGMPSTGVCYPQQVMLIK
jgi:hypothetical protein